MLVKQCHEPPIWIDGVLYIYICVFIPPIKMVKLGDDLLLHYYIAPLQPFDPPVSDTSDGSCFWSLQTVSNPSCSPFPERKCAATAQWWQVYQST